MKLPGNSRNSQPDSLRDVLRAAMRDAVTVGEAAQVLGVTPRTVQRRIEKGELKTIDVDGTRFVRLSSATPALPKPRAAAPARSTPTRTAPPKATVAKSSSPRAATPRPVSEVQPVAVPPVAPQDDMATRYVSQLERENAFLRSQIEAHARAEAELRVALREALRAMPKALPGGGSSASERAEMEETPLPRVAAEPTVESATASIANQAAPIVTDSIVTPVSTPEPAPTTPEPIAVQAASAEATNQAEPEKKEEPEVEPVLETKPEPEPVVAATPVQAIPAQPAPAVETPASVAPPVAPVVAANAPVEPTTTQAPSQVAAPATPIVAPPVVEPDKAPEPVAATQSAAQPAAQPAMQTAVPNQAAPINVVEPPLSGMGQNSRGGYKSVHSRQRSSRPFWKVLFGMR